MGLENHVFDHEIQKSELFPRYRLTINDFFSSYNQNFKIDIFTPLQQIPCYCKSRLGTLQLIWWWMVTKEFCINRWTDRHTNMTDYTAPYYSYESKICCHPIRQYAQFKSEQLFGGYFSLHNNKLSPDHLNYDLLRLKHPCIKSLATAKVGLAHYDSFGGGWSQKNSASTDGQIDTLT